MDEEEEKSYSTITLRGLDISSFRNYEHLRLDSIGNLTVLVGKNAVGKTSIIEAIQLMTSLQSFRTRKNEQMVKWGNSTALLSGLFEGSGRSLEIKLSIQDTKRHYQLNSKNKSISDLQGLIPSILFCPDHLSLIKGSQSGKRAEFDTLGTLLSKNYYVVKKDYETILKQKNQLLKEEVSRDYLESINDVVAAVGSQLLKYRFTVVEKIRSRFQGMYSGISGSDETVQISYIPSWEEDRNDSYSNKEYDISEFKKNFSQNLVIYREEEQAAHRSKIGPQADKIHFYINGKNAALYASQGQQRSLVLAFKLAEIEVIKEDLKKNPILLLDDVMSELDEKRREAFMEYINSDIQTFITTTSLDYFNEETKNAATIISLPFKG